MNILQNINEYVFELIIFLGIAVILFLIIFLFILFLKKSKKEKSLKRKLSIIEEINKIDQIKDYNERYDQILKLFKNNIKGNGYFLYVFDKANNHYRLKRIQYDNENMNVNGNEVEVGYGRILSYEEEGYSPPLIFAGIKVPNHASYQMEGRFPLLVIPINGNNGFISISTRKFKLSENIEFLDFLSEKFENTFRDLVEIKEIPKEEKPNHSINKQNANNEIMKFALGVMGATSGIFINVENNYCNILSIAGFDSGVKEKITDNIQSFVNLSEVLGKEDIYTVNMASIEYESIPNCIRDVGLTSYIIQKHENGIILFCYEKEPEKGYYRDFRKNTIELLMVKMTENSMGSKYKKSVEFYFKKLEIIAGQIDFMEPYTQGNSELMRHFTFAISKQLQLSEKEKEDNKLAACLSNIGVVILPETLLVKNGVYSEEEYEAMKKHVHSGAFLTLTLTGNKTVSDIIKYHHERIDGLGYPEGLSGEDIPLGSRILAVVQTFSSKIRGRNYREPMSFEKIIEMLKLESGKSLEGRVVNALVKWFIKKQKDPKFADSTLGPCWEMRCSPKEVCTGCMAYKRTDRYCWTFEKNNCINHGNTCETCYIYTEFMNRKKVVEMDDERINS